MIDPSTTPRLPIPDLGDTTRRYLQQLMPLLSPDAFAHTESLVQQFLSGPGPELQSALQAFDVDQAAQGKSWLIDAWLDGYLSIRTPLPLSSNIGVSLPMQDHDLATWVAAFARVCADYQHGRLPIPVAPTGTPHCMAQWQILQGAARMPRRGHDEYHLAPPGGRHIGVLHKGFYHRLRVLDDAHEGVSAASIRAALDAIQQHTAHNPYPVTVPCFRGSDEAAEILETLCEDVDNAQLLAQINDDLFHVCLRDESVDEDGALANASFVPQQDLWCYKPITLIHNRSTQQLHMHCEHSWEDGATLRGIAERAQATLPALQAREDMTPIQASGPLGWNPSPTLQNQWPGWQQNYEALARSYLIRSQAVAFDGIQIPRGISQDALMQFVLQYAQLATWGRVRNTYEAVDASHFHRGRTECVRPVSQDSLAFVQSLLAHKPDAVCFEAALAEHKARVKACKQGQGPNRHLLGLQLMATRTGQPMPALYADESYRTFTTDFLSTSTLGTNSVIRNIGFAPSSEGGLGINYTLTANGWLYTICCRAGQEADAGRFARALHEGGRRLLQFVAARG